MEKHVAEAAMTALLQAGSAIAVTVEDIRSQLPEGEFKSDAKAAGEILASIQLDLMAPIIRRCPELDPDR